VTLSGRTVGLLVLAAILCAAAPWPVPTPRSARRSSRSVDPVRSRRAGERRHFRRNAPRLRASHHEPPARRCVDHSDSSEARGRSRRRDRRLSRQRPDQQDRPAGPAPRGKRTRTSSALVSAPSPICGSRFLRARLRPRRLRTRSKWMSSGPPGRFTWTVDGAMSNVSKDAAAVLDPPLRGGPWVAIYAPLLKGGHRTAIYTVWRPSAHSSAVCNRLDSLAGRRRHGAGRSFPTCRLERIRRGGSRRR